MVPNTPWVLRAMINVVRPAVPWDLKLEVLVERIEEVFLESATLKLFLQFEDVLLM